MEIKIGRQAGNFYLELQYPDKSQNRGYIFSNIGTLLSFILCDLRILYDVMHEPRT